MPTSPEWTRAQPSPGARLEGGLASLVKGHPGEAHITWILTGAKIRAIEQLEALTSDPRTDADTITVQVFRLAREFCEEQSYKAYFRKIGTSEEDVRRDVLNFFQTWAGALSALAKESRKARRHGILHEGEGSDLKVMRELFIPIPGPPSALSSDSKRRRVCPADIDEILPPPPKAGGSKPSLANGRTPSSRNGFTGWPR